jgi:hypothetical protein
MTFHERLLELESELLAEQEVVRSIDHLSAECAILLDGVEREIGMRLADNAANSWRGWLSYRRKDALVICRGRAFAGGSFFKTFRAGLDYASGLDSINDYRRNFDVSPPQELDHLLLNFGRGETTKVFLFYGENIAPYRLIYQADVSTDPTAALHEAIVEACIWIVRRPKSQTLLDFLKEFEKRPE